MTRYVLDPAALLQLCLEDLSVDDAHRLVAPQGLRSRMLDLLLTEVRAGRRTAGDALALHERATGVKIRLLGDRVSRRRAWTLATERDLAGIELAEYLSIAQLQADALIALDPELAAAAVGVVPLATLEDLRR